MIPKMWLGSELKLEARKPRSTREEAVVDYVGAEKVRGRVTDGPE